MSELDKIEYEKLTELATKLETVLNRTGPTQAGVSALLTTALGRIENLQHEGVLNPDQDEKRKNRSTQEIAIAAIVARETRLNEQEKASFAGFLEKDAFEKKDFKKLEQFYTHSYDKLSDDGKAQMSHRIEEGIRRGNFERDDLPTVIQEKHSSTEKIQQKATSQHIEEEQQTLFENHDMGSQTDDELSSSSVAPSEKASPKETASTQDAELLAKSFEGISFAATDLPKNSETSTGRTA